MTIYYANANQECLAIQNLCRIIQANAAEMKQDEQKLEQMKNAPKPKVRK